MAPCKHHPFITCLALALLLAALLAPGAVSAAPEDAYPVTVSILSVTPNPVMVGQAVIVSVQVSAVDPAYGIPAGRVQVRLGPVEHCFTDLDAGGQGSCALRPMETGLVPVVALYLGKDPFLPAASAETYLKVIDPELWQTIYLQDFETPAGTEWGLLRQETTPSGAGFLGQYGNDTITFSLHDLAPHRAVSISFDLYLVRSWDGNQVNSLEDIKENTPLTIVGPDRWGVNLVGQGDQGGQPVFTTTFSNWDTLSYRQSFPLPFLGGNLPARTGAISPANSLGYDYQGFPMDAVYHLVFTFDHTAPDFSLAFFAENLQSMDDESWGLDNVWVQAIFEVSHRSYLPVVGR